MFLTLHRNGCFFTLCVYLFIGHNFDVCTFKKWPLSPFHVRMLKNIPMRRGFVGDRATFACKSYNFSLTAASAMFVQLERSPLTLIHLVLTLSCYSSLVSLCHLSVLHIDFNKYYISFSLFHVCPFFQDGLLSPSRV